jgi:transposase
MRGTDRETGKLFSYASPESLVPHDHPLRAIRPLVNAALEHLSPAFQAIYAQDGRPSIAPERLLRALLLQALFTVRSERQLMQQITYNMLFRWFVGLPMDVPVWDVTVFTKNRDRLLEGDVACGFLTAILSDPAVKPLLCGRGKLGRAGHPAVQNRRNLRHALARSNVVKVDCEFRVAPQWDQADSTCWRGACLTDVGPLTLLSSSGGESGSAPERKG